MPSRIIIANAHTLAISEFGVSDSYTVITARNLITDPNVPGLLSMLSGRGIILPVERDHWPAQEFLGKHRRAWRL
ncbi:hypothetical protein [Geoalkalibacter halelectricus]|uniref:Uncharacterized protein n=1 Tax=Geoalkalibacter halelectricus TaxID=2847045 RepID=A0ABY5ZMK0_9BACT|nr:hypothetical protein [Geoalkalibacter halelectricus]MDO3380125.1 hypothetical protein [Geoalkalibacter halelectricus]UWZ80356.1 hypothetical protein L9S41_02875 [Geoalkalibacter halelectricus]